MFHGMPMNKPRHIFRSQSGAFDLPSIMIGVAVVAILTVGVLAAIFGVIPWSQDKAAQQDLDAVHTAQGAAFAKDGGFMGYGGLVEAKWLSQASGDGLDIRASGDGRKYVGVSTSKTGKKFIISAEAPTPRPLTSQDKWLDGQPIDPDAPAAPEPPVAEAGPTDTSAILATHTCGPSELVVTQAMKDHSDDNVARKSAGKDLVPYPGGGWSIMLDVAALAPGMTGAIMTTDGEYTGSYGNMANTSGPAFAMLGDDECTIYHLAEGGFHSTSGPANVAMYSGSSYIAYYVGNEFHREDGPAVATTFSDGSPQMENWYLEGVSHRADGPASVTRKEGGIPIHEKWYLGGKLHRIDGPAQISFDDYGEPGIVEWFFNDEPHRVGGPAYTLLTGGDIRTEKWYQNGELHRTDGPAHISYPSGNWNGSEAWHLDGRSYDNRQAWIDAGGEASSWPM